MKISPRFREHLERAVYKGLAQPSEVTAQALSHASFEEAVGTPMMQTTKQITEKVVEALLVASKPLLAVDRQRLGALLWIPDAETKTITAETTRD